MKNKFIIITLGLIISSGSLVLAQEGARENNARDHQHRQHNDKEDFARHKSEILNSLNEERAALDKSITCIKSAQAKEDLDKCHKERNDYMKKLQTKRLEKQKEDLQKRIDDMNNDKDSGPREPRE